MNEELEFPAISELLEGWIPDDGIGFVPIVREIKTLLQQRQQEREVIKLMTEALQEIVDNEESGFHDAALHAYTAKAVIERVVDRRATELLKGESND